MVEIVYAALGRSDLLASASLANEVGLAADIVTVNVAAISDGVGPFDGFAVHFCQKNVGNRAKDRLRRALQKVRQPDEQLSFPQANRIVNVSEGEEVNSERGRFGPRPQFAKTFFKDCEDTVSHSEIRLAREFVYSWRDTGE